MENLRKTAVLINSCQTLKSKRLQSKYTIMPKEKVEENFSRKLGHSKEIVNTGKFRKPLAFLSKPHVQKRPENTLRLSHWADP